MLQFEHFPGRCSMRIDEKSATAFALRLLALMTVCAGFALLGVYVVRTASGFAAGI